MFGHGKPSYRIRESLRKNCVAKSAKLRYRMKLPKGPKITLSETAVLSLLANITALRNSATIIAALGQNCRCFSAEVVRFFSERFQTSRRSVWYKW
jgi:hypothetical protein